MASEVHSSVKAIKDMEAACTRFARVLVERLSDIERELRRITEALEERRSDLRSEIAELEEKISSADEDDDVSWQRNRVEEAEEELTSVHRRKRSLSEMSEAYREQARKAEHLANSHTVQAREFLNGAVEDLKAYLVQSDSYTHVEAGTPTKQIGNSGSPEVIQPTAYGSQEEQKAWSDKYMHPNHLALTSGERTALAGYQEIDFEVINERLRGEYFLSAELEHQVAVIDSAIKKSIVPADLIVFRGTHGIVGEHALRGSILDDKAFLSTSLHRDVAEKAFNRGTVIRIRAPKGIAAIYMDSLHPPHGNEVELLLPRGTRLLVTKRSYINKVYRINATVIT